MSHYWSPAKEEAPVFLRCKGNDSTIRALTLGAVELHRLKTEHARLSSQHASDKASWDHLKLTMVG